MGHITKMILKRWTLNTENGVINADVPGDIVIDHYNAGIIDNPYFGLYHKKLSEVVDKDFVYKTEFDFIEGFDKERQEVVLCFGGVDLFSEIYLNNVKLGETDNMFKEYEFNVSQIIKDKNNILEVRMISTTRTMKEMDCKEYFGVFNIPRVLLRKEQCCFGWDWAPNVPSYGIWKPVELKVRSKDRITDVHYFTDVDGEAIIHIELNYFKRSGYDKYGNFIEVKEKYDDKVRVSVATLPNQKSEYEVKTFNVSGNKMFATFKNDNPELWWPIGYGKHPLYNYKVELIRNGKVISEYSGELAYRTVGLKQKIIGEQKLGYQFTVNGENVYIKGSNWVPIDSFTGCIKNEKYEKLINQAKDANINMLRVWGGGIYENDIFYDLCDKNGIMVWQDFMFACGDIPDNDSKWLKNTEEECVYQIKRLRNHPSIIYWCGGNEKTGSFGTMVTYGDYFVDTILRGIVNNYDGSRPYGRQSPCSFTDIGNDINSGESHHNSAEQSIENGMVNYRKTVAESVVPFVSECAIMGPASKQLFEKIFPKDKLWPINEYWNDRLMDNPYAAIKLSFVDREKKFAEELYGETTSIDDFIKKAMLVHAESLKCEIEYERAFKGQTFGFLNWMFSEIWPTGTWSIVDYYTEPKQAYYQVRKSFSPVLMSFYQNKEGKTVLFGVNDSIENKEISFTYGLKDLDGNILWKADGKTLLTNNNVYSTVLDSKSYEKDAYLFVDYVIDGKKETTLYSDDFWRTCDFNSDYSVTKKAVDENTVEIKVKANRFAKDVVISTDNDCEILYSDNYFDVEANCEKIIKMTSNRAISLDAIKVKDYATK